MRPWAWPACWRWRAPALFAGPALAALASSGLVLVSSAWAEASQPVAPAPPAAPGAAATSPAPFANAPAAPYQDRVIEGQSVAEADETERHYDSSGLPRGYSLESIWSERRSPGDRSRALGLQASAYLETLQYGTFSGQASLQNQRLEGGAAAGSNPQRSGPASWTLRQIGMPFERGWRANNSLGVLNVPAPELSGGTGRISLPSPGMRGLVTQWQQGRNSGGSAPAGAAGAAHAGNIINLSAAWGEAGGTQGFPLGQFEASQGHFGLLSGHFQTGSGSQVWRGAAALGLTRGTPAGPGNGVAGAANPANTEGLYLAARRGGLGNANGFVQINSLSARGLQGPVPSASGWWLDAGTQVGAHQYSGGLFHLEPQLAWLGQPVAADLRGVHWRHAWHTRQWQSESSLELLDSVSGAQASGYFAQSAMRHQYSSRISLGGSLGLRRFAGDAQALMLFGQQGSTRAQLDMASAAGGERQQRLQLDQDWGQLRNLRLSSSLSVERLRSPGSGSRSWGAALNADWDLNSNFNSNHSLQARFTQSGTRQYSLNSGVSWRFASGWSVIGNVFVSTGSTGSPVSLAQSPLTAPQAVASRATDRGVFIGLRYQQDAGRSQVPLGGVRGQGAGRLEGSVFLDANGNATREASERGAASVTVLLNGRFSTQTDVQGRFEFPFVAAGEHVLTVQSDNLPLPWTLDKDGRSDARTSLRVFTRETTRVHLGAKRP